MDLISTRERWRGRLPHWEVEGHWHFVTIRCSGSLPLEVKRRVLEIHRTLESIDSQDTAFHQLQRKYFSTIEKYLDRGTGFAPFTNYAACRECLKAVHVIEDEGWLVGDATIMPNHVHLLIYRKQSGCSLREVLIRFKGRSAKWTNHALGRSGKFWQQDWFDRWMRHEGEFVKTVKYIRDNPVKAKLCEKWDEYPYRINGKADS